MQANAHWEEPVEEPDPTTPSLPSARVPGSARGLIVIRDDFDEPLDEEFEAAFRGEGPLFQRRRGESLRRTVSLRGPILITIVVDAEIGLYGVPVLAA